jgi:di/tripeptidase
MTETFIPMKSPGTIYRKKVALPLDIVSFGPTIRGAHAPGESVDILSVDRSRHLLKAILAAVR